MARLILALLLIFLCIAVVGWIWTSDQIPTIAAEKFGPPSRSLGFVQRTLYSARLLADQKKLLTPVDPKGAPQPFTVELGESVSSVSNRLVEGKFIPDAESFRNFLVYSGLDTGVQAGKYQISPAMTPVEIARMLQDYTPETVTFNILAGWRAEEIAAALPTSGIEVDPNDFMAIIRNPPADLLPAGFPQGNTLEGYLMPGTYEIKRSISERDLVALFAKHFDESVPVELRNAFAVHGMSLEEAVILASIVEREAVMDEEKPMIASVFHNRLRIGMKLDSDPTVQYALGFQLKNGSWWKNPLTKSDLQIDSRYNTYIYPGLPPAPIANPGLASLRAVAYPEETGYFYFRAKCDGSGLHAFSVTYEEHLQNACP